MNDGGAWAKSIAEEVSQIVRTRRCRPSATYRLQFEPGQMTFGDAARLVPYLAELGVSHVYGSPCLKVRKGGNNGYAIVDYGRLNAELGSEDDFRALVQALRDHGMGQVFDTVPNHMNAAPADNPWWHDILENGPASPHAGHFDIDWRPIKEELRNKVLLPILGNQYGQVLEAGELQLEFHEGALFLRYFDSLMPIEPRSYRAVLTLGLEALKAAQPADSEAVRELESIVTALTHLPEYTETEPPRVAERLREKEVTKARLRVLVEQSAAIADYLAGNVRQFNGQPGDPRSFDLLDGLLNAQVYRLAHWKAAADEINYRRFFDVNELAAVCTEAPAVFEESHALTFDLLVRGEVAGLRIDHIDGLFDPTEYLRRLQRGYLLALGKDAHRRAAERGDLPPWAEIENEFLAAVTALTCTDRGSLPLYVVVEKILGDGETLPDAWLAAGTTGYDFLNAVGGLFVDPAGLTELVKVYGRFTDERAGFREVAHQSKLLVFRSSMSSELQLLAYRLNRISEQHRGSRDFTLNTLRVALREILACFPVYRTYIHDGRVSDRDRQVICRAAAQAKRLNPATNAAVFDFVRDVLLLEAPPNLDEAGRRERDLFVGRVQQLTSPVTAKGIEDTAFYRYFPLVSLNEVGGDPEHGPVSVEEFHRRSLARQASWPQSLICTSTHDTKRSEDLRARIDVLAEIPALWHKAVNRWARLNRRHRGQVDGQPAPSHNDEYLFYQNLMGAWPASPASGEALRGLSARMAAYMEKATREAKVHTSWMSPDPEYDAAVRGFVTAALDDRGKNRFLADFRSFHESVVEWGLYTALSQTLLKLASPGVPDIYQGQELWDFSLVDPDNRRPVDFSLRQELLAGLRRDACGRPSALLDLARTLGRNPRDPRLKLFVTWRLLRLRCRQADLFGSGEYVPLAVEGSRARHLCAFARRSAVAATAGAATLIVVAPRLIAQLTSGRGQAAPMGEAIWGDTAIRLDGLPASPLTNLFTGQGCSGVEGRLRAADALADFPLAVLMDQPEALR